MVLPPTFFSKKQRVLASMTTAAFLWAAMGTDKAFASSPWTHRENSFSGDTWITLRSSADGSDLVGTLYSQEDSLFHVKYSSDAGITWTDITPNDPDVDDGIEFDPESVARHQWKDVDISSDGNTLVLADYNGDSSHSYIWYSPNHGSYWTKFDGVGQPGSDSWSSVTMGNDGEYIAASSEDTANIAVSIDYGNSWDVNMEPETAPWTQVSFSPGGSTLAAIESGSGYVFISENQGAVWLDVDSPQYAWTKISAGDDGTVLVGGGSSVPVYVHKDSGDGFVWSNTELSASGYLTLGMSGDGQRLVYGEEPGYIAIASTTDETTWSFQDSIGDPGIGEWTTLAANYNGSKIYAAGDDGVWVYDASLDDTMAPTVTSVSPADGSSHVSIDTPIVVNFSEPMYEDLQITTNSCDEDCPVYDESWSDDATQVTLTRNAGNFDYDTDYTLSIFGADSSENAMVDPYVWNFRTENEPVQHHSIGGTTLKERIKNLQDMGKIAVAEQLIADHGVASSTPAVDNLSDIKKIQNNLSVGMTGVNVKILQDFLVSQNAGPAALLLKAHGTTTYFGNLTKSALIEWQKAHGVVPPIGAFGPITRGKIKEL